MTALPWDYLPPEWVVTAIATKDQTMIDVLNRMLTAGVIWRKLTKPQRELLLSAAADCPVLPRADVKARMVARGLVDEQLAVTEAGRLVVRWRS